MRWDIGRITKGKTPTLSGTVTLNPSVPPPEANPVINLEFKVSAYSAANIKVDSLNLTSERYKPFKGVRNITKGGNFQIRT